MRILIAVMVMIFAGIPVAHATGPSDGPSDTLTVFDVDGISQNGRVVEFGRVFADGEISNFPQPLISGQTISIWQANRCKRYPSGYASWCKIAYVQPTLPAGPGGGTQVTFTSNPNMCSSCSGNNPSGYLSATQMANFDVGGGAGVWDVTATFTAPGNSSVVRSFKTMLAAVDPAFNSFGDCKNYYVDQGPAETTVKVEDCTPTTTWDLGWLWMGGTMSSPATGNAARASIHLSGTITFFPTEGKAAADITYSIPWTTRYQDQMFDVSFQTSDGAGALQTRWTRNCARKKTDVITNGTSTISSVSGFSASDKQCPIWLQGIGYYDWFTITDVPDGTHAVLNGVPSASSGGVIAYLGIEGGGVQHTKSFGIGSPRGMVRFDHNLPYLVFTKWFPNYDQTTLVTSDINPNLDYEQGKSDATPWVKWIQRDLGEIGGWGGLHGWQRDYSSNSQGAPMQRYELEYLYSMGSCGQANSNCSKTWQLLTGEAGLLDTTLNQKNANGCHLFINGTDTYCKDAGGLGAWYNEGNVPYHFKESDTAPSGAQGGSGNYFYVPKFADKDALINATCSTLSDCQNGTGLTLVNAFGRAPSIYTHSDRAWATGTPPNGVAVGDYSIVSAGWLVSGGTGCDHMLIYSYTPFLLTGKVFYQDQMISQGSWCINAVSPSNYFYTRGGFFGYINPAGAVTRALAFGTQAVGYAALVSPDGSPEETHFKSLLNSNMEVEAGFLGINSGPNTPSDTSCSSGTPTFNYLTANRWNWGACFLRSTCTSGACTLIPNHLHQYTAGTCPTAQEDGNPAGYELADFVQNVRIVIGSGVNGQALISHITGGVPDAVVIATAGSGYPNSPSCQVISNPIGGCTVNPTCTATASGGALTGVVLSGGSGCGVLSKKASAYATNWMQNALAVEVSVLRRAGLTSTSTVSDEGLKHVMEMVLIGNPYLTATGTTPLRNPSPGPTSCGGSNPGNYSQNADQFHDNYADWNDAFTGNHDGASYHISSIQRTGNAVVATTTVALPAAYHLQISGTTNFNNSCIAMNGLSGTTFNYFDTGINASESSGTATIVKACNFDFSQTTGSPDWDDHGYHLWARSALALAKEFGISSSAVGCPGGLCTASAAWTWAQTYMPFFGSGIANNNNYAANRKSDLQIKQAFAADSTLVPDNCSVTAPTVGQSLSLTFSFTGINIPGQGNASTWQFLIDGIGVGGQSGTSPYSKSVNTTGLSDGPHTAGCVCGDDAGGSGNCPAINFFVSNIPPPPTSGKFFYGKWNGVLN